VSEVAELPDASFSYSSLPSWRDVGRLDQVIDLLATCWRSRAYGDFWSYMLVAEGAVDAAAEPDLALYDLAALTVIVEEAGGRFTDLDGVRGAKAGSAVATNGRLHAAVLSRLSPEGDRLRSAGRSCQSRSRRGAASTAARSNQP
jgi:histidinol-phosphatase